ncbi:glucose-6-phosphate isomerase [Thiospirochaeta perfilievii]|uniref:Glucose-6-phosphate isomerase n=1 Tax=Thiospirochaeta perfilievii TaxID=252967 RepID=A0A5C1QDI1_9SPIO|nr:glucose-6-phosphate isomerase [Thiospirochaeta perfilievii]QEN04262.1 glucose-6-phosphate isomerase [Thiospirochaeta perfilievii]
MSVNYVNLDKSDNFKKLLETPVCQIKEELSSDRIKKYSASAGAGLVYNFAGKKVNNTILTLLQGLADEQQLIEKYKLLLNGDVINTGEKRMVLHHHTRGMKLDDVVSEGQDMTKFYDGEKKKIYDFAKKVHNKEILGSTGKPFDTVVQVGIGGSDLGPRAIYLALKNYNKPVLNAHFIANVDPDDANNVLSSLNFETTLFVLVSKSGTTQETLTNQKFVLNKMEKANISGLVPLKHFVSVTSATSPLAADTNYLSSFFIDNNIGGRFSSSSAVGGCILSLALGPEIFERFLSGAREADKQALNSNIFENAALLDALIGVYENNVLNMKNTAVIPYSESMSRFPAHLQQLDMESNGKSVNRFGDRVSYSTGVSIFGEPGTNSQHSFFQYIHQATSIIPVQFIGFRKPQIDADMEYQGSTSGKKLNANLVAQMTAMGVGKDDENKNKNFDGERPTSLLHADQLTPETMGAILAHFENKVMFQGFTWNINSFDQEGVQLGKLLANKVLNNQMDDVLKSYADLMI